jgi:hypothetical protein
MSIETKYNVIKDWHTILQSVNTDSIIFEKMDSWLSKNLLTPKWTCQLSRDEINDLLKDVDRSIWLPDHKLPAPGIQRDAYDAAIEKLFDEFEQLHTFEIIGHPSIGDFELEYQLELYDVEEEIIGTAVIIIGEEAKNPVDIIVEFYI